MKNLILIALVFILFGCKGGTETVGGKQSDKTDEIPSCTIVSKSAYFTVYRCPIAFKTYVYCAKTNAGVSSSLTCAR